MEQMLEMETMLTFPQIVPMDDMLTVLLDKDEILGGLDPEIKSAIKVSLLKYAKMELPPVAVVGTFVGAISDTNLGITQNQRKTIFEKLLPKYSCMFAEGQEGYSKVVEYQNRYIAHLNER